jgi:MoxR-like ATPase
MQKEDELDLDFLDLVEEEEKVETTEEEVEGTPEIEDAVIIEEAEKVVEKEKKVPAKGTSEMIQEATAGEHSEVKLDLGLDIGAILAKSAEAFLRRDIAPIIEPMIKAEAAKLRPTVVKVDKVTSVKMDEILHKSFKEALFLAHHERQLMLVGPAGSGKTTLGNQLAKAMKKDFSFISCSAGMSEAHLLGRMLFDGTYVASDFVTAYEKGGVFLFDEIDAADSNTLLVVNSALANGYLSVPNRKDNPSAARHKDFICIVSGNSWGHGSVEYQGRGYLDAAFLDRFALSKMEVDYDVDLEKELSSQMPEVAELFWKIRKNVKDNNIRRVVSTRAIISGVRQRLAGKPVSKVKETFFKGWTKEEIAKATK